MKSKIFKYIYAMLCLLPAIAVGVTCLYVVNNDNAYRSYSGNSTQIEYVNFVDTDKPIYDVYFTANRNLDLSPWGTTRVQFFVDNLTIVDQGTLSNAYATSLLESTYIMLWYDSGYSSIYFSWLNAGTNLALGSSSFTLKFDFINYTPIVSNADVIYKIIDLNGLDNVFYYSLDKVENSDVFSWVKSNFLYSGVNQFVGIFGGTNSNISFYLTWVLTISLCYLGFEVLMLFINMARNLIHSFTDKDRW